MLRVHFTDRDLARTVLATEADPLWETVLGMHQLGGDAPVYGQWRHRTREELRRRNLTGPLRFLHALAAPTGYFPDFLTPPDAPGELRSGLTTIRGTPRGRLRNEVTRTARTRSLPSWAGDLARGDRAVVDQIADALELLHGILVDPWRDAIESSLDAERHRSARAFVTGGVDGMLASLGPAIRWQPPILSSEYPTEADIHLGGRGIRLIPSYFCWRTPVALADPALAPVLVYPIEHGHAWVPGADRRNHPAALGTLLGQTRAKVLEGVGPGATTTRLAARLGVSPASASEHLTVLRDAGLVRSQRAGQQVLHELTSLGDLLLAGRRG